MKILLISLSFPPRRFGGTTAVSYTLAKSLVQLGHDVTVYTTDIYDRHSRIPDVKGVRHLDGIKVHYYRNVSNWLASNGFFLPVGFLGIAGEELSKFDIIHLHQFRTLQIIVACRYALKYGIPYVLDAHGSVTRATGGKSWFKWPLKWLFDITFGYRIIRNATRVIAQNDVAIQEYKSFGVKDERIAFIPLFFPVEEFSDLPPRGRFLKQYGLTERRVIMSLGRINPIKGLDFLIESFYELSRSRHDIALSIVGPDDGYRRTLERLVVKLNLSDRVIFPGVLSGQEKLSALVDADILVQPSRYEQAAWAPLEAVLCGTPIIVSRDTGSGEDVKRLDAGYLVEYGNKQEMVVTLQKILDDPSEARAKTQKARDFIWTNLSLTSMIEDYEKIYKDCIEEKQ